MLLCREPDLGFGHRTGQRPAPDPHHLPDSLHPEMRPFEAFEVRGRKRRIDKAKVPESLHTEDVSRDPAHQLHGVALFPERERISDLHEVPVEIERLCLQFFHPGRQRCKRCPGPGRALGRDPAGCLLVRDPGCRFKIKQADNIVLCRFVVRIDKLIVPVNCHDNSRLPTNAPMPQIPSDRNRSQVFALPEYPSRGFVETISKASISLQTQSVKYKLSGYFSRAMTG